MRRCHLTMPNQRGYVLLLTLIQGIVFMTILMSLVDLAFANYKSANQAYKDLGALGAAEAGADAAVFNLNLGSSYTGTTGPSSNVCALATSATSSSNAVTFASSPEQGLVTYETCITDTSAGALTEKTVYSVGKVYAKSGAIHPMSVRRVKLVVAAQVSGTYSVQTGNGGLVLSNSATIANGNVYVNGGLTMTNTSQIGTSAAPATVNAANYLCPKTAPYTGYPMLCASGQPISIANTAHIYADVHANGQTDGSGMTNTGLVQTAGVATLPLPDYDRAAHKAAVVNVINGSQSCGGTTTVTYPANTRINGNLTGGNNCQIILLGNIWVTGTVALNQKAIIKTDNSLTVMPTMMIDGSAGLAFNQQSGAAANAGGIGTQFITFYSTAPCSPDCADVTGADLYASTPAVTINLGNQSLSAGSRFYARWTALTVSQGGAIGSVVAQKLNLANSGTISFTTAQGTSTYTWVARYYEALPVPDSRSTN